MFLLYFDPVDPDRFGTIRQSVWAIAHFPLNLAFLLTLEGANQMALFIIAFQQANNVANTFINNLGNLTSPDAIANSLNSTFLNVSQQLDFGYELPTNITNTIMDIAQHNLTDDDSAELGAEIVTFVFNAYGYTDLTNNSEGLEELNDTIASAFLYLFISAGAALITLAALLWLGKRRMSASEYGAVGVRAAIGVALCLISLMNLASQENNLSNFVDSPWTLPTVMLSLALGKTAPSTFDFLNCSFVPEMMLFGKTC